MSEEVQDVAVAAYVREDVPLVYFGELYYSDEDPSRQKIFLKKVLLQVLNPKDKTVDWKKAPCTCKESTVVINTSVSPGILVQDPDPELIDQYKNNLLRMYSRLHLSP